MELLKRYPDELSGGQKQRVVIEKGKSKQFNTSENVVKTPATKFVEKLVQS